LDWPEDSEDSLSSGGSDSDESVYKVLLLGAPGVGKSALARIFGGVEDGPEAEAAGHTYDRSIVVDGEEASLMVYDIWEQFCPAKWLSGASEGWAHRDACAGSYASQAAAAQPPGRPACRERTLPFFTARVCLPWR
ncbi:RRAD isoform 3, partial [Pan troglodytes]